MSNQCRNLRNGQKSQKKYVKDSMKKIPYNRLWGIQLVEKDVALKALLSVSRGKYLDLGVFNC